MNMPNMKVSELRIGNLFLEEFSQTEKTNIINELKLNHHKYRFVILPIDFDFKQFSNNQSIQETKQLLFTQDS